MRIFPDAWRYLLFDLDNTLYTDQTGLLRHIDQRINDYLAFRLGLEREAIDRLRREYWRRYGTTLRGVKENHGIDPLEYIAYTYDVDLGSFLRPDENLAGMLRRLPGQKAILSNSPEEYVFRVLDALGVTVEFARVFGIGFSGHRGKPDPETYRLVLKELAVPAESCVMVDDLAVNLIPAHDLGMTTVLLGGEPPAWVDYHISSIYELEGVLGACRG